MPFEWANLHYGRKSSIFLACYHAKFQIVSKNYSDYFEKTNPPTVSDNDSLIRALLDDAYTNFHANFHHTYTRIFYVGSLIWGFKWIIFWIIVSIAVLADTFYVCLIERVIIVIEGIVNWAMNSSISSSFDGSTIFAPTMLSYLDIKVTDRNWSNQQMVNFIGLLLGYYSTQTKEN